ncbi:MAG: SDR family NAD(P)-dependent oxidoreductase, partial [Acidobacteria bacterium]|nr:SDR family NAD(P)-dependent oxidoreductase [Acidobacteriota bacterium]
SDAVRDGDPIVAVIRASAVNQDGRTNGLTAPNGVSQQRVIRQALSRAGVEPTAVQSVEAHGTGTPLGDPIEMHAIRAVYGEGRTADQPLYVGSVKTNIGHLEAAAGVASLIKTAMTLRARTVVPHLHFAQWNPEIALEGAPIDVPRALTSWPGTTTPMAAVSAFGFGGTNVHVIVEAAPDVTPAADPTGEVVPLLLSARTPAALRLSVERFRARLGTCSDAELVDLAYTAAVGRDRFTARMGVSGRTPSDLVQSLDKWLARPVVAEAASRDGAHVAWLFTGQGSQYSGMATELYRHDVSRDVIDRLTMRLKEVHGIDLLQSLLSSSPDHDAVLARTSVTQPALYVVQCALAALWQSRGAEPAAVIGHSVGEFAAAWVAGVFSLEDGLDLIATRGRLMDTLGLPGGMVAVSADIDRTTTLVADLPIDIAALNAATQIVVAGPHSALDTFMARCEADDLTATRLVTSHAFHSALIEPALAGLMEAASRVRHQAPRLPWISNLTGAAMTSAPSPEYWRDHARQTVRFEHGVRALETLGITAGLEIGPSPVLIGLARRTAGSRRAWIASLDRRRPADEVLSDAVVALHTAGVQIDGHAVFPHARRVSAPTYPFATERHWFETPGEPASRPTLTRTTDAKFYDVAWQSSPFPTPATGPDLEILRAHLSVFEPALRAHTQTANLPDALQALDSVALDWAHAAIAGLADGGRLPGRAQAKTLEDADIDQWNVRLGIAPRHHRLANRLLRWLVAHDRIVRAEDGWRIVAAPDPVEAATRTVTDFPEIRSEAALLSRCGPQLRAVLRGDVDPLHVLFPGGDFAAAAAIYTDAPAAQLLNGQVAAALATYLSSRDKTERIRLLELGAGTGGLTTYLLPVLAAWGGDYEYVFTDLSPSFLEQAKAKFSAYRGVDYRLLDLESLDREPTASYDLALAANAVHAVAKLAPVLRGLRGVLRPSGQLWLLEGIRAQGWLDLTFGLTEGWWKAADGDGRSSYPLLSVERWSRMLADAGFEGAAELSLSTEVAPYALIGASRPQHANTDTTTRWILAGRRSALRDALHSGLSHRRVVDVSVDHLGEALATEHTNDTSRTHVVLCLDDVVSDGAHPDQVEADAVAVSAVYLDALRTIVRHNNTRVSLVTRGARPHPAPGERDVARLSAASVLWGLGKTTSLECPDHWAGVIDLDPAGDPERDARRLIDELTDARAEDQQVWRGGVRWVPRLRTRPVAASASGWPAARGSVLITGGTGAMGVQTVAGLARAGYRHFVLFSRRGHLADESAALLNSVRALGAVVHLVQGDASTAADVARAIELVDRDGQSLQGIIHAAGVAHAESLALSTREDLERVYRAKIQAPLVLQALSQDRGLDFFVAFSSMVSLWGAKGQAVYAAGNHFLDDWAVIARQQGIPARAINWGPVSGGGMVPAAELAKVATLGVRALPVESIPRLLAQAMTVPSGHVAALDVTWEVFRAHFESRAPRPFFDNTRMPVSVAPSAQVQATEDLRDLVRREVAAVLGHTDPTAIDTERGFFDIGLDSLTIVQLKTRLEESLGLTLPSTLGLEYPS